jgi:general secretion pathway protein D
VKNRDKARVHIGERVPVITTTSTANVGVSSSVSYLETGLKLDVEPNIHLEDEVAIKVQLEVSNILEQLNVAGTVSYRLGTRNAATTLRLKDGETQVLAGLINSEDRKAAAKVPYLGDFPLLGRLFRSDSEQRAKTEIVLLITPHIVRNLARPDTVSPQFSSGTDSAPGAPPLRVAATAPQALGLSPGTAPAAAPAPKAAPPAAAAIALLFSAPTQVALGRDFAVSLRFPPGLLQSARANVEMTFDHTVLEPVQGAGVQVAGSGRLELAVVGPGIAGVEPTPAQVRFRVIGKVPTTTEINLHASGVDDAGRPVNVRVPDAHVVEIVE